MAESCKPMSTAEVDAFLGGVRQAVIGTNRRNGPPQMSPVWYLWEDRRLVFATSPQAAKYRNLQRDPRVSACVHTEHPDSRTVMMHGRAELPPLDSPAARELAWRVVRRYFDNDDAAREYLALSGWERDLAVVILNPERIIAQDWND
jgi:PPOX class probable F420-dependent enzyme